MNTNELELNSIERIGLDKIKLSGFAVAELDIQKLLTLPHKVTIQQSANQSRICKRHMPVTNIGITKIIIKDNNIFSDLTIGCANDSRQIPIEYTYLTITVANIKGYNLENMSYTEYTQYISLVLEYIHSEYGIELRADYMKVDYLEINANIFLQYDFSKYNRVLKLLMSFFHNHLGKLCTYERLKNQQAQTEFYRRENKSIAVVFYDKQKELKELKYLEFPSQEDISILRIELRLKNKKKIESVFDSCFWKDLNDIKIVEQFNEQIYTQLSKKFNDWQLKKEKELKKLIISCREKSSKNWHHLVMQEIRNKSELQMIPYILDIEQICSAFLLLPDKHRNAQRSIKSLLNIPIENDTYKKNDMNKVVEILNTLKRYSEKVLNPCQ